MKKIPTLALSEKKPVGAKLLRRITKIENSCATKTEKRLPKMGKKALRCYEYCARLLAYADMIGSCAYGCPGGGPDNHTIWYLSARMSSFGRAALRLMKMGFYDEALIIVRSMGELTNLFTLFDVEPVSIEEWKRSDRRYRRDKLGPGRIRERIEQSGDTPFIDKEHYAELCEISTHPVPQVRPQGFNPHQRALTGGIVVQDAGILVVLNEMAVALSLFVLFAAKLCKVPSEPFKEIRDVCAACVRSAGFGLQDLKDIWEKMDLKNQI